MKTTGGILQLEKFSKQDIIYLLSLSDIEKHDMLLKKAYSIKEKFIGNKVFLRGIIEFSNACRKNCLYCGIRSANTKVNRYFLTDDEILDNIKIAQNNRINGIVLQSGEQNSSDFTKRITQLIVKIIKVTNPEFRITLSLGEQTFETYKEWFDAGAQRYLLRIETSSEELYKNIHPDNRLHNFKTRNQCIENIKKIGYQTGTGVMIGLPFQSMENLADDLLYLKKIKIDMVGMGPYIEHADTPLYKYKDSLLPLKERFDLSLRMIAVLRLMMPEINIAATTALQSITANGREQGLLAGANVLMPNLTPRKYRKSYQLYDKKSCVEEESEKCMLCLTERVQMTNEKIAYNDFGDSKHFINRTINL